MLLHSTYPGKQNPRPQIYDLIPEKFFSGIVRSETSLFFDKNALQVEISKVKFDPKKNLTKNLNVLISSQIMSEIFLDGFETSRDSETDF